MTFGDKLKYIREKILRMSQEELAASIERSQGAITAIERGVNKKGSFDLFCDLVRVHDINPYFFIYDKTNEPPLLKGNIQKEKALTQKLARYEKLIDELQKIKNGKA